MTEFFLYFSVGLKFWERFGHHLDGDAYVFDLISSVGSSFGLASSPFVRLLLSQKVEC